MSKTSYGSTIDEWDTSACYTIYGIPVTTIHFVDAPAEKTTPAEPVIVNTKQIV
jgi:hypothetical protein